jgi:hypothetical protein
MQEESHGLHRRLQQARLEGRQQIAGHGISRSTGHGDVGPVIVRGFLACEQIGAGEAAQDTIIKKE